MARDEPVELAQTLPEGWLALLLFFCLAGTVAYQFFTRYVLESSAAWTEEIARYLLIALVFLGASVGVAKNDHIRVGFLYRYLPRRLGRVLSLAVDALQVALFACLAILMAQMMWRIGGDAMTVVPLPMNIVYAVVELAFIAMTWRSLGVLRAHSKHGGLEQLARR